MIKMSDDEVLRILYDKHMITLDDLMTSDNDTEEIMYKILKQVHHYNIGQTKDGRWYTYVPDDTKPSGLKQIRRNNKADLYKDLLSFYGIMTKSITLDDLEAEWIKYFIEAYVDKGDTGLSQSTATRYNTDYHTFFDNTKLSKMLISRITTADIVTTISNIIRTHTTKGHSMFVSRYKSLMYFFPALWNYAIAKEYIIKNPMLQVDKKKLLILCTPNDIKPADEMIITADNLQNLKAVLKARHTDADNKHYMPDYAVELAIYTGLRAGEIAALRWSDIRQDDYGNCHLFIDYSEHRIDEINGAGKKSHLEINAPKCRKHRQMPISDDAAKVIESISEFTGNYDYLFTNIDTGIRYSAHDIGSACRRRGEDAGVNGILSIQRIRRTVSSMLNLHTNQITTSAILGHSVEVDERNYNTDMSDFNEKRAALNAL